MLANERKRNPEMSDGGMGEEGLAMAGLAEKRMVIVESEHNDEQPDERDDELVTEAEQRPEELRLLEALLFATKELVDE